jgi:hypothetical protein
VDKLNGHVLFPLVHAFHVQNFLRDRIAQRRRHLQGETRHATNRSTTTTTTTTTTTEMSGDGKKRRQEEK